MNSKLTLRSIVAVAVLLPATALAHVAQNAAAGGFLAGAAHPFSGADHLLAMLAVGVWAAQNGGRSRWLLPTVFVLLMLAGALAGRAGLPLPGVDMGIAASLLVLGLLIASALRTNACVAMLVVAFFAIFHGHAHGSEMPLASSVGTYFIGFALATACLHGVGIGAATLARVCVTRSAGAAIALSGIYFALLS